MKSAFVLVSAAVLVSAVACTSKKTGAAPGETCTTASDCNASKSCDQGFCSVTCTKDSDCLDTGTAAGPTCTKFTNGTEMCCPTKGCPINCSIERDGLLRCQDDSECCSGDVCAQDATKGGKACFTKCSNSLQCKTNCCAGTGLTDGSGQLAFGCVPAGAGYTCMH
jgi:hypothetical protein